MTDQEREARAKEVLRKLQPKPSPPVLRHMGIGSLVEPDTVCGALFRHGHDYYGPMIVKDGRLTAYMDPGPLNPITCPDCLAILDKMRSPTPAAG